MQDFKQIESFAYTVEQYMASFKVSRAQAMEYRATALREKRYENDKYRVFVSPIHVLAGFPPFIHLTIERVDSQPVHSWAEFQEIKNMLVGPEHEAMELYPAESRLVDMAHQYHAWVLAQPQMRIPLPYYLENIMAFGPKRKPVAGRLWSKVDMSKGPEGCWEFTGATNGNGYGVISRPGDSNGVPKYYAHRLSYCLANGLDYDDLPPDLEILHSCDNRRCCNPQHLSLGTSKDNKQDAIMKNRMFWQKAQRNASGQFMADDQDLEGD